jgi:hypothetical protein
MSLSHQGYLDGLVASVVEEEVEVGVDLRPRGVLQVGEEVEHLLRLFLLHYVHSLFLLRCLLPHFLLLVVEVVVVEDSLLDQNLGLYHYPLLLILLPLMSDRCPSLLDNSRISLCPWANGQSHHTPYNVC